jgi:hypothetical protein
MTFRRSVPAMALIAALACAAGPAGADDVPYAQSTAQQRGLADAATPRLGDIMNGILTRHAKLWYAGSLKNWPLAQFEIGKMRENFFDAARLYGNIPVDSIALVTRPLDAVDAAIAAKNPAAFTRAYGDLTTGCNACHQAATVAFIVIRHPTTLPFTNQSLEPLK